jgi:protocatechuate 3,4-dioxygenase beta subunit
MAVTVHATSPEQKQESKGQNLPVVATVPTDEAVKVRPDTAVSFQLDTRSPEFRAFRQQFESGRFAIQVEDGSSARLFLGEQRANGKGPSQPSAGVATFDVQTGTLSTPALSLRRYTTYTVTLAVKAAYEALLHGQPLPGDDSVSFAFITGSALREPTHYALTSTGELSPRVTGKASLTVSAVDDYGNAASGAHVVATLTEDGSRLASSAVAIPAQATLPASGSLSFDITDTEAEGVQVAFQSSGAYPENAWSGSLSLRFRPGLPTQALLRDLPAQAQVGTRLTVKGTVVDVYGNTVEDGTAVSVGGQSVTTEAGAFSATQLLPTLVSDYTVEVRSSLTVLGSAVIHLLPGDPGLFRDLMAPSSVVVGSGFEVSGQVTDVYGNTVLDGTTVTVNGVATTTATGLFSVPVTAPTKTGSFSLVIKAGSVTWSRTVHARSGPPAAINDVTVPASVVVASAFDVCGAVADAYDNAVSDGTAVTVNGVAATTTSGAFCASVTAPTRPGAFNVSIQADAVSFTTSTQVRSGAPAAINSVTAPTSVTPGSQFNVCGAVADAYGNAVLDGTAVTVSEVATTTRTGSFCALVTAPTKSGPFNVVIQSGTASVTRSVQVMGGPVATITDFSFPASVETNTTFEACAIARDAQGYPVADGSMAYVQGGVGSTVWTSTVAGRFCGQVKAPSYTASFSLYFTAYDNATYRNVSVSKMARAVAPPPVNITVAIDPVSGSVPADGYTGATLTASVTDKYGRLVADTYLATWTTTLGSVYSNTSHTSGGKVSAMAYSSVTGTAAITVSVGSLSRTVYVTFTRPDNSGVASISGVSYSQSSYYCSGADSTYRNFGYGTYFRAMQNCNVTVTGTAYTSNGTYARNAAITVSLSVSGGLTWTSTVYTDSYGRFTLSPYVYGGYGSRSYSYYVNDYYGYRRVTDYWDWGTLSISSMTGRTVFTDHLYTVKYRR